MAKVKTNWAIIEFNEILKPCPYCGDKKPVMVAAPTRFGIQCDNPKCLALVYTDFSRWLYRSNFKLTEKDIQEIVSLTIAKWNRRQNE